MGFHLRDEIADVIGYGKKRKADDAGNIPGAFSQSDQKIRHHFAPPFVEYVFRPVQGRAVNKRCKLPVPVIATNDPVATFCA